MSAATETVLLAAGALGLGSTWLAIAPLPERIAFVTRTLALPGHVIPFSMLPIGYPLQEKAFDDRFSAERIFFESYC